MICSSENRDLRIVRLLSGGSRTLPKFGGYRGSQVNIKKLKKVARDYAKREHEAGYKVKGKVVRKLRYTDELADLIEFGVNVFIRLSDIKDLRHKHVKVVKKGRLSEATLLELTVPHPKTNVDTISVTMPKAVPVYEGLLKRHKSNGFGQPDDYVFYPSTKTVIMPWT